jgi:putative ABC transport system substrate-binding protein
MDAICSPEMPRRAFMAVIAGGFLAAPLAAQAQPAGKVYRVGVLSIGSDPTWRIPWKPFVEAMSELGYIEGRNLVIRPAFADGNPERLPGLVAELINAKVDAIVVTGPRETVAAKRATAVIPIVMTVVPDPVAQGFVASLARPGGNVTGLTSVVPGLGQKYVELLHEALPSATRFAVVASLSNPLPETRQELEAAGRLLGITVSVARVSGPDDFDGVLARAKRDGAAGVIATNDGVTWRHRKLLVQVALKHRLPAIYWAREYVSEGGLMTYSASVADLRRRAATYVDKILKGAKPADLPVEQPATFELVINLKAGKALGLTIPSSLLQRADQVIE